MFSKVGLGLATIIVALACGVRIEENLVKADDQKNDTSACILQANGDGEYYAHCAGEREYVLAASKFNLRASAMSIMIAEKLSAGYRLVNCSDADGTISCYLVK